MHERADLRTGRRWWAFRVAGLSAVALGLLLWARLKLVTDTPRMVYAEPPVKAPGAATPPAGRDR